MPEHSAEPADRQVRQIDEYELANLLRRADWQNVGGRGPWLTVAWCRTLTVHRHEDLESAQSAMRSIDRTGCGGGCHREHELLEAVGEGSQRRHVGCEWRTLNLVPWRVWGGRRPKHWGQRYDPKRRAAFFADHYGGEPDVDRQVRAILKRADKCADCAREAGEEHLAKLRKALGEDDQMSISELASMPLDALM